MLVCSVIALAAIAPEAWQALVLMSISYAAAAFTIVSIWCLPADVVDSSTVATLGSTQNFFSNIGSALSPIIIGALYGATGSFKVPLLLTAAIIVAGALCFGLLIKKVEPIRRPELEAWPPDPSPDKDDGLRHWRRPSFLPAQSGLRRDRGGFEGTGVATGRNRSAARDGRPSTTRRRPAWAAGR